MRGKKAILLVLGFILLWTGFPQAAEPVKVAVFPFDVFSREPLGHLRLELQKMVTQRLTREGVKPLPPEEVNRLLEASGKPLDLSLARVLAGRLGADYAVYGSVTKIGSRVSLDAKVLDVLGMARPQSAFVVGVGLDELPILGDRLAREMASSMSGLERVAEVQVKGNRRIESAAVKETVSTKQGGPFSPLKLDEDLRAVWKMGYFDDVKVETADSAAGKVITFVVHEKPQVREVHIQGNKAIDSKDLSDSVGLKAFSVYQPGLVKEAEAKMVKLYHDKGYFDVKVVSQVSDLPSGDKRVRFLITEGNKLFIKAIRFTGNKAFEEGKLRDQMTTEEEGWLSWLTETNILDRAKLDQDRELLQDFYYNNGYMTARVGEPRIGREKGGLVVTFDVVEGGRFKVSAVTLSGEMIKDQKTMMAGLQLKPGDWFNRENLRRDLTYLQDLYADQGFAYVQVRPKVDEKREKLSVGINYSITKGQKVYFERIIITGNNNTRDNVIRRELGVAEGELFSSKALRQGNQRLRRLNFFEDVHVTTSKGSTPDRMNLKVDVKEKRTGSFSVGAGYSTVDNLMVMGSVAEANLFGRGQRLELRGQVGGSSTRYSLSFTEPWLLDRPVSLGIDVYNWDREYTTYDKEAIGGRVRFGFPTPYAYTRFYVYYSYEEADISNIDQYAARIIKEQQGLHSTSAVKTVLRRDSRNHFFNPTEGSDHSISVEYAGEPILGGSNDFIKVIADTGWYIPVWWNHVVVLHGRMGWMGDHSGGEIPMYEKFFLGGINTLRGFDYQEVGPKDPETRDTIGGECMAQINLEYRFPLVAKAGLVGVLFHDMGNVWTKEQGYDFSDLRKSVGAGIRWYSPMGPLRLEYGWVLDPEPDEKQSQWEFTIGSFF